MPLKQNTIQIIWAFVEIVCIYSEHQKMFFTIKLLCVSSQSSFVFLCYEWNLLDSLAVLPVLQLICCSLGMLMCKTASGLLATQSILCICLKCLEKLYLNVFLGY